LMAGRGGVGPITRFDASGLAVRLAAQVRGFDPARWMSPALIRQSDAFSQYAYAAAAQALQGGFPAAPERRGVTMGTAMAGVATTAATQEALTRAVHKNVGPRFVPRILGNMAAAQIAIAYDARGPSLTLSTACASGGDAISAAAQLLLADEADAVLAVGADSILCPLVLYSLANAGTLSRRNDAPELACRPFDRDRSGFVIGEGGGALLLERERSALERGAVIYAELAGWASTCDAYHATAPLSDGAKRCMELALAKAGMTADGLDYINTHGVGTEQGDRAEAQAIQQVFGARPVAVSSTKGATGHMMGASGVTEAIACIQAIRTGGLPPTLGLEQPEFPLNLLRAPAHGEVRAAMSNSFGFGGQNSCLILRTWQP
ncbi:MAG: beta-ketoacyl-[acyl-carrier-protein] synthase family protein, partial [Oscillospiraceae bacterium]|nr:beta-ketoacyl-[acyl-carrier-protein] synthase family protein [Oscillospiraceae bacterium]